MKNKSRLNSNKLEKLISSLFTDLSSKDQPDHMKRDNKYLLLDALKFKHQCFMDQERLKFDKKRSNIK